MEYIRAPTKQKVTAKQTALTTYKVLALGSEFFGLDVTPGGGEAMSVLLGSGLEGRSDNDICDILSVARGNDAGFNVYL